jgi:hypothetical protein
MTKSDHNKQNQSASPEIAKYVQSPTTTTTTTTTKSTNTAWSMSEDQFFNLLKSIKTLTDMIVSVQTDVVHIKASQEAQSEKFETFRKKIEDIETSFETLRESTLCEKIKEDVSEIKKTTLALDQEMKNDRLILRNLPLEICDNKTSMNSAIKQIFSALELDINDTQFEAFSTKASDRKSANIVMKFSSSIQKSAIIQKYRKSKQQRSSLLVSKIFKLPESHSLNGKLIVVANKLSSSNAQLMQNARKYVPSHFSFVYDTPDSKIMVNIGDKFHKIENNHDIANLIGIIDDNRQKQRLFDEVKKMFSESERKMSESYSTLLKELK